MKVILINGSPNEKACTYTALAEVAAALKKEDIESEIIQLGRGAIRDCTACYACVKLDNKCVFDDDMINGVIEKIKAADGLVLGTPVYYAHPSGRILSLLNRVFFAGGKTFAGKPGAAVASARRAGTTAALDVLNKYFSISKMPVISSTYWNMVHGRTPDEVKQDAEGLQTMRTLGANMAWFLRSMDAAKKAGIQPPEQEPKVLTNFIR